MKKKIPLSDVKMGAWGGVQGCRRQPADACEALFNSRAVHCSTKITGLPPGEEKEKGEKGKKKKKREPAITRTETEEGKEAAYDERNSPVNWMHLMDPFVSGGSEGKNKNGLLASESR